MRSSVKGAARRRLDVEKVMAESLVSCAWLQEHWLDKRDPNIVLLDGMLCVRSSACGWLCVCVCVCASNSDGRKF